MRDELRPRAGRLRTSLRMGVIAAVGAAMCVTLHIESPLGALMIWVALYASNARMTVRGGVTLIAVLGAALIASVFLAGALLDAPWLLLPLFGLVTSLMTYEVLRRGLAGPWFLARIAILDTFFLAVFIPDGFGWPVAHTFAGIAIVTGVLVAFDMALWPDPAERRLLASLAHTLDGESDRLAAIMRAYVDPRTRSALPAPAVSILPAQLPLLERARRELANPKRAATLLAAVSTTESLHLEIERLLVIVRRSSHEVPPDPRDAIDEVCRALTAALHERAREARAGLRGDDPAACEELRAAIRSSLAAVQAHEARRLTHAARGEGDVASSIAAFDRVLHVLGDRLERPLGHVEDRAFPEREQASATSSGGLEARTARHAAKIGLAATLAYVIGLASQRADLSTIVWATMIVALPTYGATLRRMFLYVVGAIFGGVLAVAIILVVSPNFHSLAAYLTALCVVLSICGYVGLSSGRLAYAGDQAGVTFILAYYTLNPSGDVTAPLWRLWGILLGLLALGVVFLLVKPDFAARAIAQRLTRLLRGTMELLRPGPPLPRSRLQEINGDATLELTRLLAVAQDARLEGRRSGLDADRVTEAASTLRRIMQRLSAIAIGRQKISQLAVPADIEATRAGVDAALRAHLAPWLDAFERFDASTQRQRMDRYRLLGDAEESARAVDLAAPLIALHDKLSASVLGETAALPIEARSMLLAGLEAYGQLGNLVSELDQQLLEIEIAPEHRP